jgi:signal transduction histidine kinase
MAHRYFIHKTMSRILEKASGRKSNSIPRLIILTIALVVLCGVYRVNFLLFHSVVEILGVVIAAAIFMFAWNVRQLLMKPFKERSKVAAELKKRNLMLKAFKQREFELQQSKAMLQAFLNSISDPMLMIDKHLHVVYSNRAAAKAYSLNIQGDNAYICTRILHDESGQCSPSNVQALMESHKPASFELNSVDTHRVEKVYIYPFSEKAYGLEGAVVRIADITEAKVLERHLIHSEKMSALGMLVAGMVHEINNPNSFITFNLPILRAYLEKIFKILDSHSSTATYEDWFGMDYPSFRKEMFSLTENLSHGSSRITNIISNLKTMTHPRQISTQKKWVDLMDIIDKAVALCRSEIRKRVKVFEVTPTPCPIRIKTDPEALEQVIINLLINASHAADKRESWVRIATMPNKDMLNPTVIVVSDNGCGMTQETMARIFDPFYTTKGPGVGTGLGLSVSYNLMSQLGGKILVDSKLDKGTQFRVVIPLDAVA